MVARSLRSPRLAVTVTSGFGASGLGFRQLSSAVCGNRENVVSRGFEDVAAPTPAVPAKTAIAAPASTRAGQAKACMNVTPSVGGRPAQLDQQSYADALRFGSRHP